VNASGVGAVPEGSAATVTTRSITPIPVPRAARKITLPSGPLIAVGSVHVEPVAQRARIEVTRSVRLDATLSVQPIPLPRPSATVTGT